MKLYHINHPLFVLQLSPIPTELAVALHQCSVLAAPSGSKQLSRILCSDHAMRPAGAEGWMIWGTGVNPEIPLQWLQDGAPKIAKLVYKWLNNGLW